MSLIVHKSTPKRSRKCSCVAVREIRNFTLFMVREMNPDLDEWEVRASSQDIIRCVSESLWKDLRNYTSPKVIRGAAARRALTGTVVKKHMSQELLLIKQETEETRPVSEENVDENATDLPDVVNATFTIRKHVSIEEIFEETPVSVVETRVSLEFLEPQSETTSTKKRLKEIFKKILQCLTSIAFSPEPGIIIPLPKQPDVDEALEATEETNHILDKEEKKVSTKLPKCKIPVRITRSTSSRSSGSRKSSTSSDSVSLNSPISEALCVFPNISHKVNDLKCELDNIESVLKDLERKPSQVYVPIVF